MTKFNKRIMKSFLLVALTTLTAMGSTACFPSMLNRGVMVPRSSIAPEAERVAVISRVDIQLPHEVKKIYVKQLKRSIVNSVYNSGVFTRVYLQEAPPRRTSNEQRVFVDISLEPDYDSEIDWMVTWPAIYPMGCYWPIQHKEGVMRVKVIARVYDEKGNFEKMIINGNRKFDIYIYGFFRTAPMEIALKKAYEKVLLDFSTHLGAVTYNHQRKREEYTGKKSNAANENQKTTKTVPAPVKQEIVPVKTIQVRKKNPKGFLEHLDAALQDF